MAAKTLEEALYLANIDMEIKKALCIGPLFEVTHRIEGAEQIIVENLKLQLRDFFAHQVMYLDKEDRGTATELFDKIFKDIPAVKKNVQ